jgi:hypothetical protein
MLETNASTVQVAEVAARALAEYKQQHPEVDEKNIKVDLPPPAPRPAHPQAHHLIPHVQVNGPGISILISIHSQQCPFHP